ncbi:dihydrofolate reductase family protein [Nonomuraea sp. B1E8]|uniref:RibD family protein n=1 Tax=unclassified Nonomuraea TaxID=2593643 RepID=UPI00325CDA41
MEQESGPAARPRVVVSVSTSVDGRVTLGSDRLLMEADAARIWQSMQPEGAQAAEDARSALLAGLHQPQAVLEGSGSLVTDSTGPLTGLPEEFDEPVDTLFTDFLPEEVVGRPGHEKWFTVVDSRGRVPWSMKRNGGFDLLVLVARATPAAYLAHLRRERIPYLVAGGERVDLAAALRRMRDKLAVTCVVSTAGGGLNGALLRAGLIDEIQLLVIPAAIGGRGTPALFDGPQLAAAELPTRLRLLFAHVGGDGMLWLRYEVIREAGATS